MSDSFVTPWTVAHQAPLSMGSPRQEYWSMGPFPPPGDLPKPGIDHISCIGRWVLYHWATREAHTIKYHPTNTMLGEESYKMVNIENFLLCGKIVLCINKLVTRKVILYATFTSLFTFLCWKNKQHIFILLPKSKDNCWFNNI